MEVESQPSAGSEPLLAPVRLPDGRTVRGSRSDAQFLYTEIFTNKCYEQHGIQISGTPVVVDVGANIGLFALRVTDLAPQARVYCFEPVPPTYACLQANVAARAGVRTFNTALMAAPQALEITFYPHTPGNSTLFPKQKAREIEHVSEAWTLRRMWHWSKLQALVMALTYPVFHRLFHRGAARTLRDARSYHCQAMTLDQLFETQRLESVDLLKVDVEGAERAVFEGLSQPHLERVRQLVVEVSPDQKPWLPAFEARLSRAGFDRITLQSMVAGGEPRIDAFPCNLYATRSRDKHGSVTAAAATVA